MNRTGRRILTAVAAPLLRLVPWSAAAQRVRRIGLNDEPLARPVQVVGSAPQRLEETRVLQAADGLADRELLARDRFAPGGAEWLRSRRRS